MVIRVYDERGGGPVLHVKSGEPPQVDVHDRIAVEGDEVFTKVLVDQLQAPAVPSGAFSQK